MSQILQIFRKDARHHWPEIMVSIALLITFVAEQPHRWTSQMYGTRLLNGLINTLPPAMILAWAFLVIRLVQSEGLIGDRQFWITRPYEWHKLLAAKLLSIAVYILAPVFVSQVVLLKLAEFPVMPAIPSLLLVLTLFVIAIVVPSLTIGTITSGIGQAALAILGVLLVLLGLVFAMFKVPDMDFATDSTDWLQGSIYLSACLIVIVLQYAYRRAFLARLIAGGAVALIAIVIVLAPYEKIISRWFPLPDRAHPIPVHFKLDRTVSFAHAEGWSPALYEDDLDLEFPFVLPDLDDKFLVQIRAIRLDLDLPDGKPWTSHWHSVYNHTISVGRTRDWPEVTIKRPIFISARDAAVRARVTLGLNVFRLGDTRQILVSGDRIGLPGGARCLNDLSESLLHCFSAFIEPVPMLVVAELPSSSCPLAKNGTREPWASSPAFFANLGTDSSPSLDFTPIQQFDVDLSRYPIFEDHQVRLPLCSGTRLIISKPEFLYSVRDEIDLGEINLANYHPSYPRRIVPPAPEPPTGTPSNTLSKNFAPELKQSTASAFRAAGTR